MRKPFFLCQKRLFGKKDKDFFLINLFSKAAALIVFKEGAYTLSGTRGRLKNF